MTSDAMVMDVSRDWAIACDVQQSFMHGPDRGFQALDYSGRCRQMLALGGDCYDFVPMHNGCLAVTIGDASGKSVPAALMISSVQSSLRTAAAFAGTDLSAVVSIVNQHVYASSLPDRYATLFYGTFDPATRTLRYVNAGHNPPMVVRRDGSVVWLEDGGAPVGMFPDTHYEAGEIRLNPGDLVVAYTDGVIESVNAAGKQWGVEGLLGVAAQWADQRADDILEAILVGMDAYSQGRQADDVTVVVLRVH